MRKESQIVVRVESALMEELDHMTRQALRRWDLGIEHGYRYRPTRSAVVRQLIVRALDRDQRERLAQRRLL